jgi:hypothetical protein
MWLQQLSGAQQPNAARSSGAVVAVAGVAFAADTAPRVHWSTAAAAAGRDVAGRALDEEDVLLLVNAIAPGL